MKQLRALIVLIVTWLPMGAVADTYLLMAEEHGCYWCGKWNAEVAHIYPKTDEGRTAPLRRFDIYGEQPDVSFASKVRFTPTFILVHDGAEVGRIEGYPGQDFFWGLLNMMLEDADIPLAENG